MREVVHNDDDNRSDSSYDDTGGGSVSVVASIRDGGVVLVGGRVVVAPPHPRRRRQRPPLRRMPARVPLVRNHRLLPPLLLLLVFTLARTGGVMSFSTAATSSPVAGRSLWTSTSLPSKSPTSSSSSSPSSSPSPSPPPPPSSTPPPPLAPPAPCPKGYYLNSVRNTCDPLGPLGRVSQWIETSTPWMARISDRVQNLCGIDPRRASKLGVAFALSYSAMSQINGSITLSVAWYMSARATGVSPFAPGRYRGLLSSYAAIYALVQVLKPFRVAAAVAASRLSHEFLRATEAKLRVSRRKAIAFQYVMGWVAWAVLSAAGIAVASHVTGVPVFATAPTSAPFAS